MRELALEEISMVTGGSCAQVSSATFGGSIAGGGVAGMQRGMMGGIKGMLAGGAIGAIAGAITFGTCYFMES